MSRGLPCLLIVIIAGLLHFGPAADAHQRQPPATIVAPIQPGDATIHGRVADRDSSRPLIGATVQLLSGDLRRSSVSRTDVDGEFSFDAIAPGDYRLVVMHAGYVDQAYGAPDVRMARRVPEAVITVNRNSRKRIDFRTVRAAAILGRVIAEDGRPLKAANVTLTIVTDRGIRVSRWSTKTNDTGEYLIGNVPEGNFQLSVVWDQEQESGVSRRSREIYYPGTADPDQANIFTVTAGETLRNIDIAVPLSNLLRIEGTFLRDSSSEPIGAYLLGTAAPQHVPVTADGRFSTPDLSAGRYTLVARAGGDVPTEATWYAVDLSSELTNLVLGLMPTGIISGRVVTDDGSPVPAGLRVAAVLADRGKEIDMLLRDTVAVESDGAFELRGMFGERVLRVVGNTHGWAVDRVVVGKRQTATIEVQSGSTVGDVQIIVTR